MKYVIGFCALLVHCTSGADMDARNKDFFTDAANNSWQYYTTASPSFTGATPISTLVSTINGLNGGTPLGYLPTPATSDFSVGSITVEGIVTIPSNYSVAFGNATATVTGITYIGCGNTSTTYNNIFQRSFILEDSTGAILVAYGLEPPIEDTTQSGSMKYITNSRNMDMAPFGNRVRLTVTRGFKYGGGTSTMPIVTDFTNVAVISTRNSVPYVGISAPFTASDLFKVKRIEGYIYKAPLYSECPSGTARQFQFNYQKMYLGEICTGLVSSCNALTCSTCSGTRYQFQMSRDFGAGTLTGFDYGNAFSYNFATGAHVRLTGAVFLPEYNTAYATGGALMLTQKLQVESLP